MTTNQVRQAVREYQELDRTNQSVSLAAVAREADLNPAALGRFMRGEQRLNSDDLVRLLTIVGLLPET